MPNYSYSGGDQKKSVTVNKSANATSTSSQNGGNNTTYSTSGTGTGGTMGTSGTPGTNAGTGTGVLPNGLSTMNWREWFAEFMRTHGMTPPTMPQMPTPQMPQMPAGFPFQNGNPFGGMFGQGGGTPPSAPPAGWAGMPTDAGAVLGGDDPRAARLQMALDRWHAMRNGDGTGTGPGGTRPPGMGPPMPSGGARPIGQAVDWREGDSFADFSQRFATAQGGGNPYAQRRRPGVG